LSTALVVVTGGETGCWINSVLITSNVDEPFGSGFSPDTCDSRSGTARLSGCEMLWSSSTSSLLESFPPSRSNVGGSRNGIGGPIPFGGRDIRGGDWLGIKMEFGLDKLRECLLD